MLLILCKNIIHVIPFRYIDDILTINYDFNLVLSEIHPCCLVLNATNHNNRTTDFLDLSLNSHNDSLYVRIFDKRKIFNFNCHTLPYWTSCLHKCVFRNVTLGQLTRFFLICSHYDTFRSNFYNFSAHVFYNNYYPLHFMNYYFNLNKAILMLGHNIEPFLFSVVGNMICCYFYLRMIHHC